MQRDEILIRCNSMQHVTLQSDINCYVIKCTRIKKYIKIDNIRCGMQYCDACRFNTMSIEMLTINAAQCN